MTVNDTSGNSISSVNSENGNSVQHTVSTDQIIDDIIDANASEYNRNTVGFLAKRSDQSARLYFVFSTIILALQHVKPIQASLPSSMVTVLVDVVFSTIFAASWNGVDAAANYFSAYEQFKKLADAKSRYKEKTFLVTMEALTGLQLTAATVVSTLAAFGVLTGTFAALSAPAGSIAFAVAMEYAALRAYRNAYRSIKKYTDPDYLLKDKITKLINVTDKIEKLNQVLAQSEIDSNLIEIENKKIKTLRINKIRLENIRKRLETQIVLIAKNYSKKITEKTKTSIESVVNDSESKLKKIDFKNLVDPTESEKVLCQELMQNHKEQAIKHMVSTFAWTFATIGMVFFAIAPFVNFAAPVLISIGLAFTVVAASIKLVEILADCVILPTIARWSDTKTVERQQNNGSETPQDSDLLAVEFQTRLDKLNEGFEENKITEEQLHISYLLNKEALEARDLDVTAKRYYIYLLKKGETDREALILILNDYAEQYKKREQVKEILTEKGANFSDISKIPDSLSYLSSKQEDRIIARHHLNKAKKCCIRAVSGFFGRRNREKQLPTQGGVIRQSVS